MSTKMNEGVAPVKFDFHGDELHVVPMADGDVGLVLKRLCESIGVDVDGQSQRLAKLASMGLQWASTCVTQVQVGAQRRNVLVIPRCSIPMWAATVDLSRVKDGARAKLVAYQNECADVLAAHFLGDTTRKPASAPVVNVQDVVQAMLPVITQVVAETISRLVPALMAQTMAPVTARLDAVEQRLAAASTDPGGTIGPYVAKQLVGRRITALARLKASRDASRTYRGHRAAIENELRARLNWFGLGSQWRFLPTHRRGDMERELDRLEQIERGVSEGLAVRAMRDAAAKQTAMPWGAN